MKPVSKREREKIRGITSSFRTDQLAMYSIPTITRHNIRTFVGEQNFLKGQQLVRDGAILNPEQQAKEKCDEY